MSEHDMDTVSEADAELLMAIAADGDKDGCEAETAPDEVIPSEAEETEKAEEYLNRIMELEERLRTSEEGRAARERELECIALLNDAGLPGELKGVVMASTDMTETVELIRRTVQSRVDSEVSRRCRSAAPVTGSKAPLTKDELMKMPVAELQRLRNSGFAL